MMNIRAAIRRYVTTRSLAAAALGLLCLWAGTQTLRMALFKSYTLYGFRDEFQYAHAAWLVSRGEVPYLDFFDHHFPLVYHLMSVPFRFVGDDPEGIFVLRVFMLPVAGLIALAAWHIGSWGPRERRAEETTTPFDKDGRDTQDACGSTELAEVRPRSCPSWPTPPKQLRLRRPDASLLNVVPLSGRRNDRLIGLLAPAVMFSVFHFTAHAVEIRPDPLSFALFLAALSMLYRVPLGERIGRRLTPRVRGAVSGFLFAASVWGSQKVLVYGLPFVAAFVLDMAWNRRRKSTYLLRDPRAFITGGGAVLALVALYLTVTGSWAAWFRWCVVWPISHESAGRLFPWQQYFGLFVRGNLWLLPFAAAGIAETAIRLKRSGAEALRDPDLILAAALPATFASFAMQAAPYSYSMLPVIGILALFAARGLVLVSRFLWRWRPAGRPAGACALALILGLAALGLVKSHGAFERSLAYGNRRQHEVLAALSRLTSPSDVCYDNSGCYVARPHAWFFYFTSAYMRRTMRDELVRDVPRAIVEKGCVACVDDGCFKSLPEELKRFLREHFQPYDGDIQLWGSRYAVDPENGLRSTFLAVRGDTYFVEPATALEAGTLTVNGIEIRAPTFELEKGEARIRYEGEAAEIYILWLPRNGRRYRPRHGFRPRLVYGLYE